jgi:predicted DsbA family dithiol-disulfide isomerase
MTLPFTGVDPGMQVEIWSDVVCPWCFVGKRNFEAALARFEHRDEVEVVWRSFELNPTAPPLVEGRYVDRLARKYGVDEPQAQAMIDRMTGTAASVGLEMRFDIARTGNTFDAHRLLHLARSRGLQGELKERLFTATFTEGEPVGDREALVRLAVEVGLDGDEARDALDGDAFADEVRADEAEATELDITGVPYFVVDRTFALSGAQLPDLLLRVLERSWAKRAARPVVVTAGEAADGCDDGDCAV